MTRILILSDKIVVKDENGIQEFKSTNIYRELEEILCDYDIKSACLILESVNELEKIKKIFETNKINVGSAYNLFEHIFNKYKSVVIKENDEYFLLSQDEKSYYDIKGDSKYYEAIDLYTEILNEKKILAKNLCKKNFSSIYIFSLLILIVLLSYFLIQNYYSIDKINLIKDKKSFELESIKKEYEIEKLNETKNKEQEKIVFFYDDMKEFIYQKELDRILKLDSKYFYFDEIYLNDKKIAIKGYCKNLNSLNMSFTNYNVNKLYNQDDHIYFDIEYSLEDRWKNTYCIAYFVYYL